MNELRNGVKLKKTNHTKTPIEYALTPYEMLMDDIRSRRYKLNKVSKVLNISRFVVIPLNYRLQNDMFSMKHSFSMDPPLGFIEFSGYFSNYLLNYYI